jgi:hypothetical protein
MSSKIGAPTNENKISRGDRERDSRSHDAVIRVYDAAGNVIVLLG